MAYRGSEEIVINGTRRATARTVLLAFALALTASNAVAQELEPGAYQNVPVGVNVFIAGYGYSTGNVLVDAALPIEGAKAQIPATPCASASLRK